MPKTPVIFVTPGDIGDRIREDLDLKWTIRDDVLPKYEPVLRAFDTLDFRYVRFSKDTPEEMDKLIYEIFHDWPDAAHLYYPNFGSFCFHHYAASNSWFYWAEANGRRNNRLTYDPKGETVSIGYFLDAMQHFGICLHSMKMDFDGPFDDEISIRPGYQKNITEIANLPRTRYELDNNQLTSAGGWLEELGKAENLSSTLHARGFDYNALAMMPGTPMTLYAVRHSALIEGEQPLFLYRTRDAYGPVLSLCQRILTSPPKVRLTTMPVADEDATASIIYVPDIGRPHCKRQDTYSGPIAREIEDWLQAQRQTNMHTN